MKKNVLIDLGNTLIYNRKIDFKAGYEYLFFELKDIKLPINAFLEYVDALFERLYSTRNIDNVEIPFTVFLSTLIHELNLQTSLSLERLEQRFYDKAIIDEPIVGVIEFLSYLKKQQVDIYVISNSMFSSSCLAHTLNQFEMLRYIKHVYSSADIGYRKPSHLFFDTIKDLKNIDKKDTIMIGNDYYFDFEFAKSIQVDFLWYNENNEEKLSSDFCYMTKSYIDLINEWSEKFD